MTNDQLEALAKLPQDKRTEFIMDVAGIIDRRVLQLIGEKKLSDRLLQENKELRELILSMPGIHPKTGPFDPETGESDIAKAARPRTVEPGP